MSGRARISSYLKLGVSMPALLLCCGLALAGHSEGQKYAAPNPSSAATENTLESDLRSDIPVPPPILKPAHGDHAKNHLRHRSETQVASLHEKKKHSAAKEHETAHNDSHIKLTPPRERWIVAVVKPSLPAVKEKHETTAAAHTDPHIVLQKPQKILVAAVLKPDLPAKKAEDKTKAAPVGGNIALHRPHEVSVAGIVKPNLPAKKAKDKTVVTAGPTDAHIVLHKPHKVLVAAIIKPSLPAKKATGSSSGAFVLAKEKSGYVWREPLHVPGVKAPPTLIPITAHYEPASVVSDNNPSLTTVSAPPWMLDAPEPARPVPQSRLSKPSVSVNANPVQAAAFTPQPWLLDAPEPNSAAPTSKLPIHTSGAPAATFTLLPGQARAPLITTATEDKVSYNELVAEGTATTQSDSGAGASSAQEKRALMIAQKAVRQTIAATDQNVVRLASLAGDNGEGIELAYSHLKELNALTPSAGEPAMIAQRNQAPAPVPIMVGPPVMTSSPAPTGNAPPAAPAKTSGLSPESQAIVDSLPEEQEPHNAAKKPVSIKHAQDAMDTEVIRQHKSIGISISVRRPPPNVSQMLQKAYDALIAGNQEDAIALYKEVLDNDPDNRQALFGLATTYHRAGQIALARPLYGRLLAIDPSNRDGLNNFLVLLADESPAAALEEMKSLSVTHPGFSPLPAQMAVIYEKTGNYDEAIKSMKHAIDLSPENLKYRYDMAVILDRGGDWESAASYYQQLLTAHERGDKIPANPEEIQERLTFIRSNKPEAQAVAGPSSAKPRNDKTTTAQDDEPAQVNFKK